MQENNETSTNPKLNENKLRYENIISLRKHLIPGMLRRRHKLPENFHETLIGLENKFIANHTIDSIVTLTELYKVNKISFIHKIGVEYYSTRDIAKQELYLNRLNIFLNSKTVIRLLKKLNNKSDSCNGFYSNSLEYDCRKSNIQGLMQMNKINYENSNSQISQKIKEMINKHEFGCLRASNMIRESLREQSKKISRKIHMNRANKLPQCDMKERSFIKRRTTLGNDLDYAFPKRVSMPYKTLTPNFLEGRNPSNFRNNNTSILTKLKNKKEKAITDIVENFLKKFYHFYQNNLAVPTNNVNMIYDNLYRERIEKYNETIETFLEFEVMLFNNSSNKSLLLL